MTLQERLRANKKRLMCHEAADALDAQEARIRELEAERDAAYARGVEAERERAANMADNRGDKWLGSAIRRGE